MYKFNFANKKPIQYICWVFIHIYLNRFCGVMVSVLILSAVDHSSTLLL